MQCERILRSSCRKAQHRKFCKKYCIVPTPETIAREETTDGAENNRDFTAVIGDVNMLPIPLQRFVRKRQIPQRLLHQDAVRQ